MKLRNFKKWWSNCSRYKYRIPRIHDKVIVEDGDFFSYLTCHNLSGRYCYDTKEFVYIIKKKRKRHGKD